MAVRPWIALGPDGGQVRAYALHGGNVVDSVLAENEAMAVSQLGCEGTTVIRIGEGRPDELPASVLPECARGLSGFVQDNPADVIGAWVRLQIAGYLAKNAHWDGVICYAGSVVSHWLHVSADEVVSCQSFLTPRLISSLGGQWPPDEGAMADSLSRPERLAAHLRVAEVSGRPTAITGHLLGAELAAARVYWLGQQIVVVGAQDVSAAYASALTSQGAPVTTQTPDALIVDGLRELARVLNLSD